MVVGALECDPFPLTVKKKTEAIIISWNFFVMIHTFFLPIKHAVDRRIFFSCDFLALHKFLADDTIVNFTAFACAAVIHTNF